MPISLWWKSMLTGILILLLLFRFDFHEEHQLLLHLNPLFLLTAIVLHLLVFLCGSFRWWLLLNHIEPKYVYRNIIPIYYLGLFSNNFLPTGFGGDVVRTAYLSTRGYRVSCLLSSTFMDRTLGLAVLLLSGLLTMIVQNSFPIDKNSMFLCAGFFLTCLISIWALLSSTKLSNWLQSRQKHAHRNKFDRILIDLYAIFRAYHQAPCLLFHGMMLSLLLQILVVFVYILLGFGLGLELPFATYFSIVPIVMLASNIPISLGGLGLREGVLVALLVGAGVDYEQGVLLSLSYLIVLWITTLPGGFILLQIRFPTILSSPNLFKKS